MKTAASFKIMQFTLSELLSASVSPEKEIVLKPDALKAILISKIPPAFRAGLDKSGSVDVYAARAAVMIPYNAALRQILLIFGDKTEEELFENMSTGELNRKECSDEFFLRKILYVKIDGKNTSKRKLDRLLKGLTIDFGDGDKAVRFCNFERSASQQRQNMLVMIREDLLSQKDSELQKRINCGLLQDFNEIYHLVCENTSFSSPDENELLNALLETYSPENEQNLFSAMRTKDGDVSITGKLPRNFSQEDLNALRDKLFHKNPQDVLETTAESLEKFKVHVSKYAAYRALMLTSGICIPDTKTLGTYLNEKSVLVIKDYQLKDWTKLLEIYQPGCQKELVQNCVTVTDSGEQDNKIIGIQYADCETKTVSSAKLFDGEGLISMPFGAYLAKEISTESQNAASLQIRMPYVKGVVHAVDFHEMFRELLGEKDYERAFVEDYFHNRRKLKDVHMILTLSMFKMYKLYEHIGNLERTNGMTVYWNHFKKGNHRLFVSNSDEMFRTAPNFTITNYQFLSTLEETSETDDRRTALISPSMNAAWTVAQSVDCLAVSCLLRSRVPVELLEEEITVTDEISEDSEEMDFLSEESEKITDAMLIQKCPSLIRTAAFRERVSRDPMLSDLSYGHLIEPGEMRFLSGDLLQLCCLIAQNILIKQNNHVSLLENAVMRQWVSEAVELDSAKFYYAPSAKEYQARTAAINRNPHLARNEHVVLESAKAGEIRQKYFGHLLGVAMLQVGADGNVQRLGGADADGDIIRIFYNPVYQHAAQPGSTPLRPLQIPSKLAKPEFYTDKQRMILVKRSSGSRVGEFSNAAFRTSLFAYGCRTPQGDSEEITKKAEQDLIKLSCMVGMEIDAVKTGLKPEYKEKDFVISQQSPAFKKDGKNDPFCLLYFLKYKDIIKKHLRERVKFVVPEEKYGRFSLVEYLPYIFQPKQLEFSPETCNAEEWAKNCHELLWSFEVQKGKQSKEETEEETSEIQFKFSRNQNKLTAAQKEDAHLWQMINSEPQEAALSPKMLDAYCATRAFLSQMSRRGNKGGKCEPRERLRRLLVQNFGLPDGNSLMIKFHALCSQFEDDAQTLNILFGLLPWKYYPSGELRRIRFNKLAKENGIDFTSTAKDTFDTLCCEFERTLPDSALLAEILTDPFPELWHLESSSSGTVSYELARGFWMKNSPAALKAAAESIRCASQNSLETAYQSACETYGISSPRNAMLKKLLKADSNREILCCAMTAFPYRRISSDTLPEGFTEDDLNALRDSFWEHNSITDLKAAAEYLRGGISETLDKTYHYLCRIYNIASPENMPLLKKLLETNSSDNLENLCRAMTEFPSVSAQVLKILKERNPNNYEFLYPKVEILWQNLHVSDHTQEKSSPEIWKLLLAGLLYVPKTDWIRETDAEVRRTFLTEIIPDCSEKIPEELLEIIIKPENWQILPAFLSYARSQSAGIIRDKNRKHFQKKLESLFEEKLPCCLNYIHAMSYYVDAESMMKDYLADACMEIFSEFPDDQEEFPAAVQEIVNALNDWETLSMNDEEWEKIKNEHHITVSGVYIPKRIALLYCLLRAGSVFKTESAQAIVVMLRCAAGEKNTPSDKAGVLSQLLGAEKFIKNRKKRFEEPRNIERFVYSVLSDVLYQNLKQDDSIRYDSTFVPNYACGFLDGSQGISLTPASNQNLFGKMHLTVKTKVGSELPFSEAELKTYITVDASNTQLTCQKQTISPEELHIRFSKLPQMNREASLLWLYSVPFEIYFTCNKKEIVVLSGELTHLRIPQKDGKDDPAYLELVRDKDASIENNGALSVTCDVSYEGKTSKIDGQSSLTRTKQLNSFIWGYQRFLRNGRTTELSHSEGGTNE